MLYNSHQKEKLGQRKMKKTEIEIANIDYLFRTYEGQPNLVVGVDYLSADDKGLYLVVYDTTEMLDDVETFEEFMTVVNENFLDKEFFFFFRVTICRTQQ